MRRPAWMTNPPTRPNLPGMGETISPEAFIRRTLPLLPVPAIPRICLHKAMPNSGLWRLAAHDADGFGSPYWAHYWSGGLALAHHILAEPQCVAGRAVLDLGAGSGIVGIAAALAGARTVLAADVDRYALAATALNAAANGVEIATHLGDMTCGPPPPVEIVLVGDLFYEAELAMRVGGFLDRCLDAGIDVLVGDPGREFLPRTRLHRISQHRFQEFGEAGGDKPCAVFSYR